MQRILSYCARLSRPFKLSLLAILLILCMVWVQAKGGITEVLHLPATLDASTPAKQKDFTLLAIRRYESIAFMPPSDGERLQTSRGTVFIPFYGPWGTVTNVLWIEPMSLTTPVGEAPQGLQQLQETDRGQLEKGRQAKPLFRAKGRSSTGDEFRLDCQLVHNHQYAPSVNAESMQAASADRNVSLIEVKLPVLYPDTYRYIDVTVTDTSGKAACWRITRLPKTRRCIPASEHPIDTMTKEGVTMHVSAHRYTQHDQIGFVAHLAVSEPGHLWGLSVGGVNSEWVPLNYTLAEPSGMSGDSMTLIPPVYSAKPDAPFQWNEGGIGTVQENPYRSATHFLRGVMAATEFDTYDEIVTFHDIGFPAEGDWREAIVEREQTVTTPSGITLTLPIQPPPPVLAKVYYSMGDVKQRTVRLKVLVTPGVSFNNSFDLPASPLCHRYHKPVCISLNSRKSSQWGVDPGKHKMIAAELANTQTDKTDENNLVNFHGSQYFNNDSNNQQINLSVPLNFRGPIKDLTIVVRQRVNIRTIPFALIAPIKDKILP